MRSSSTQGQQPPILKGQVVCLSGMTPEEKNLCTELVDRMGGTMTGSLNEAVTVVLARALGTQKCITTLQQKLREELDALVVDPSWLKRCWKTKSFQDPWEFRLQPLESEVVSTVGNVDKRRVSKAVELLGGKFSEEFDDKCTVLLARKPNGNRRPTGKKVEDAKAAEIPIVDEAWIEACLVLGKNEDKKNFDLMSRSDSCASSQLQRKRSRSSPLLSSQDESRDGFGLPPNVSLLPPTEDSCSRGFESGMDGDTSASFLDGCQIFIAKDISDADFKELKVLCRKAGATTVPRDPRQLPSLRSATHILTAATQWQNEHGEILEMCDRSPPVVTQAWLRDSSQKRQSLEIAAYEVKQDAPAQDHRQFSQEEEACTQNRHTGLKRKASGSEAVLHLMAAKPAVPGGAASRRTLSSSSAGTAAKGLKPAATVCEQTAPSQLTTSTVSEDVDDPITDEPPPAVPTTPTGIFSGQTFTIVFEDESTKQELQALIIKHGGKMPKENKAALGRGASKGRALQYQVVPMDYCEASCPKPLGARKREAKRVSEYWVRKCAAAGVLYPIANHPMFVPLPHRLPLEALGSLCLCMTGTKGEHRKLVRWILEKAGVPVKENLKKKISHLLVAQASAEPSDKQKFAQQHGIPQVSLAWLEACVIGGRPVPVTPDLAPTSDPFHSFSPKSSPTGIELDPGFAKVAERESQSRKRPLELTKSRESPVKRIDFGSSRKPLDFTCVGHSPVKQEHSAAQQPDFEAACFVGARRSSSRSPSKQPSTSPLKRLAEQPISHAGSPPAEATPRTRSKGHAVTPDKTAPDVPAAEVHEAAARGESKAGMDVLGEYIAETDEEATADSATDSAIRPFSRSWSGTKTAGQPQRRSPGSAQRRVAAGEGEGEHHSGCDAAAAVGEEQPPARAEQAQLLECSARARPEIEAIQQRLAQQKESSGTVLLAPSASKRKKPCVSPRDPKSPRSPGSGALSPAKSPRSPPTTMTRGSAGKGTPPTRVAGKREETTSEPSSQLEEGEEEEDGQQVEHDGTVDEEKRRLQLESARKHQMSSRRTAPSTQQPQPASLSPAKDVKKTRSPQDQAVTVARASQHERVCVAPSSQDEDVRVTRSSQKEEGRVTRSSQGSQQNRSFRTASSQSSNLTARKPPRRYGKR